MKNTCALNPDGWNRDGGLAADLATSLHLSPAAMKRRWERLFERASETMPELCPPSEGNVRGLQKRHRILAYVREHREELRPFDARSAGAGSGVALLLREPSRRWSMGPVYRKISLYKIGAFSV
jgi:hypothetical protein